MVPFHLEWLEIHQTRITQIKQEIPAKSRIKITFYQSSGNELARLPNGVLCGMVALLADSTQKPHQGLLYSITSDRPRGENSLSRRKPQAKGITGSRGFVHAEKSCCLSCIVLRRVPREQRLVSQLIKKTSKTVEAGISHIPEWKVSENESGSLME